MNTLSSNWRTTGTTLVALVMTFAACKGARSDESATASSSAKITAGTATAGAELPGVIKRVHGKRKTPTLLEFELRSFPKKAQSPAWTVEAAIPATWRAEEHFHGTFSPPEGSPLKLEAGIWSTEFKLSKRCQGACEPKDWKKVVKDDLDGIVGSEGKVVVDKVLPKNGHLRVVKHKDPSVTFVLAAWQREGASSYFACSATLLGPLEEEVEVFVEACLTAEFSFE